MQRPYAVAVGTLSGPWAYTEPCAACREKLKLTSASKGLLKRPRGWLRVLLGLVGLRVVLALIRGWRRVRGHGPIPQETEENGKNPYR